MHADSEHGAIQHDWIAERCARHILDDPRLAIGYEGFTGGGDEIDVFPPLLAPLLAGLGVCLARRRCVDQVVFVTVFA